MGSGDPVFVHPQEEMEMLGRRGLRQRGFTIIEVMTVVAIVSVLAAVAIPNLTSMIRNAKLRGVASDLFGDMLTARSEAVKQNCNISVIPTTTGTWTGGWKVVSAGSCTNASYTLVVHTGLDSDIQEVGTASTITYSSNGRVSAGTQIVVFYESTSGTQARCVSVDSSGVPRITLDPKTSGTPSNVCT